MENLIELKKEELMEVGGGHWYCEAAASFAGFFEDLAAGFRGSAIECEC